MRIFKVAACLALLCVPLAVQAGDKPKSLSQIEAARAAVDAFAKKAGDNKLVASDLESAGTILKRSEETFANGRSMFGLGDVNPEAGQDIKLDTDLVELYLTLGQTRLDKARAADELVAMNGQVAKMKAKVKVFDDRKAELEKLRAGMEKFEATSKDLAAAKAENARLLERTGKIEQERKALEAELGNLKAELAKRDLAASAASAAQAAPATPAVPPLPAAPVKSLAK